eukprot:SAG22_NODE_11811_length_468_cov_0.970190_2_plen_38_part_01
MQIDEARAKQHQKEAEASGAPAEEVQQAASMAKQAETR